MIFHHRPKTVRRDRGFSLPELLIAMTVSGILVSALAMAFSVIVRSQSGSQQRIAESKDVTFVQTWLPTDLSSATQTWIEPVLPFPFNTALPGTNVLTMARPDLQTGGAYLIMYRYEELPGRGWIMARYRVDNPGCPTPYPVVGNCDGGAETVKRIGVAYELTPPPPGWTPDQAPTHAIEVTRRNGGSTYGAGSDARPVGEDVKVHFKSGTIYIAGGSGLSAGQTIDPNPQEIPDPVAPPSRCGRRILIVVDQSGSISSAGATGTVQNAVTSFVQGFQGTPGQMSVVGFNENIRQISGPYGTYYDTLNDSSGKMAQLVNTTIPGLSFSGSTNWHAAIQSAYAVPAAGGDLEYHDYVPDMVVFVTDGDPTRHLNPDGSVSSSGDANAHATYAANAANLARELGVQDVIGVLVNNANDSASVNRLASVVGGTKWDGQFPGNAEVADYFAGSFSQLGGIIQSITARECGGALTIQKRFDDSSIDPSDSGVWEYQSEQGSKVLDYGSDSSVTFQHEFQVGETSKEFWIEEQPRAGWVVDRMTCKSRGTDVDPSRIVRTDPATPGDPVRFTVDLRPDEALSCFVWSDRA